MNIAVLSDIHGNHIALERCMDYLAEQNIDAYCFLGDYAGEFPGIEEVLHILRELKESAPCHMIRGNKEEYQIGGLGDDHPEWDAYPSTVGMIRYAGRHLTQEDRAFFAALPITDCIRTEGMPDIRICHGSPRRVKEDIHAGKDVNREIFAAVEEQYILCGHTHRVTDAREHGKVVWNPGSVGLPLDGSGRAQCMILHADTDASCWSGEFVALDYDIERVVNEMKAEGLYRLAPYWARVTESLLRGGTVSHGTVLARAMAICEQENGACIWPAVPEACWEKAYMELIGWGND
ncbi:MAG: metallophosphatase family protein [Roseburia sp.]|nr:metallophosphatase family protein [Roseburia sp.]